ncbi:hypothetical protein BXO88_02920 [Oribacterium sp. C9]|uniref:Panacea domain-containing protein n=1 Tax=Oribacterium sp. C9 TaxID=1943579 RepID=UPI00099020C9|nr:type II toxin-antitoxin system antitoxin SocA domain-containing protein [Oribacterium sp. C9]OON87643.1 hypothetical protein BXO88_02920 [Oribacterium sp. C9]
MIHNALDIAKYIINKCTLDEMPISDLQLQKILYFIQVNFIRQFNSPAFNNKMIAKQYGPVVSDVYAEYKIYGAMPICLLYDDVAEFTSEEKTVADWVIERCRSLNPWELVAKSHVPDGPWSKTKLESEIEMSLVRDYAINGIG